MNSKLKTKISIFVIPILLVFLIIILKYLIINLNIRIPCIFNIFTGYYCPGCGGTRSVVALLKGELLKSLYYNPIILFAIINFILFYIELIFNAFNHNIKIIPRSRIFWYSVLGIFIIYYFLRNFIAFFKL